jgi:hypothetical protein
MVKAWYSTDSWRFNTVKGFKLRRYAKFAMIRLVSNTRSFTKQTGILQEQ